MFDVDKLYVAMKEILRGKDGRLQFAKYLTEDSSTLEERKLAYLSRTDEGKKIKADSRVEIKKISEDIELAKKAQAISDDSQSVVKEGDKKFTIKEKGNPEIIETEDITSYEGTKGAAQYDSKNNQIKVNRTFLKQKFAEKAWTKPRELMEVVNGENIKSSVNALPEDQFKTYEDWEQFVINHEHQHSLYSREDFNRDFPSKKKGDYEEYINRRALLQVTDIDSLNKKKDEAYSERDEAILKLMPDEEFSKIPIEEQNTVAARNNRLIDITLGVMRNPSTAEAIFTPGGYDYLKDTVHKDITEAMAKGVGKVRKATNMFDADDVDLMTYQNIAGRDLKGIAASHNKFRALLEHSNLKMVNPFLFNGHKLTSLKAAGLDTSGMPIRRNSSEKLAASVDNGKDPLLADIGYNQHTAEVLFMMDCAGVPLRTSFGLINQKPVRDAMQMVFLGDANNLEDALKTIFKKVNSGNPYSSSKVKPVNFDEQDLIDDINSESLVHTRNVVGSLLKYIEYSKDFSKIIRASKADTNGIGKFVEEGVTLLKAMKDAMAAEAKPNEDGIITGNITGIEEFLSGLKDKELGEGSTNPNKMTQAFTKYGVELPMEEVFEKMYPYSKSLFKSVKAKIGEIAKFPLSAEENRDINDHLIQFLTSDYQFYSVGDRKEFVRKVVANFDKLKASNPKLFAENAMLRTIGTPFDKTLGMKILKFDNSVTLSQEQVQDIYEGFAELYKPSTEGSVENDLFNLAKDIIRYSYIMTGHKYAPSSVKTVIPHDIYLQIGDEIGASITDKMNDIMKMKEDKALEDRFIDQYIRNNHTNTKIVEKIPEDEDGFYKNNGITANADGIVFNGLKTPEGFPTVYVEGIKDPVLTYISMPVKITKGDKTVQEIRLFKFDNRSVKPMAMFTRVGTLGSPGQVYEYGVNIGYSNNESIIESNNISSGEAEAEKQTNNCNIAR